MTVEKPSLRDAIKSGHERGIISIERYRSILKDYTSTDERVLERLKYMEEFCRIIAKREIDEYVKNIRH